MAAEEGNCIRNTLTIREGCGFNFPFDLENLNYHHHVPTIWTYGEGCLFQKCIAMQCGVQGLKLLNRKKKFRPRMKLTSILTSLRDQPR